MTTMMMTTKLVSMSFSFVVVVVFGVVLYSLNVDIFPLKRYMLAQINDIYRAETAVLAGSKYKFRADLLYV